MTFRTIEVYRLILSLHWLLSLAGIWGSFRSAAAKRFSGGAVKKKFSYFLTTEMRSGAA